MEDDDNKRRRNLVAFSVAVCVAWFLNIKTELVLKKFIETADAPPAGHIAAVALLALTYLVWRYAVRDSAKEPHIPVFGWKDWQEASNAKTTLHWSQIHGAMQKELKRGWLRSSGGAFDEGGSKYFVTDPFPDLNERLQQANGQRGEQTTFTYSPSNRLTTPRFFSFAPSISDGGLDMTYPISESAGMALTPISVSKQKISVHWTRDRFSRALAFCKLHFFSSTALEVWLPYYLAALAAASIVQKWYVSP